MDIDELEYDLENSIGKMARFILNRAILSLGYTRESLDDEKATRVLDKLLLDGVINRDTYDRLLEKHTAKGVSMNGRVQLNARPGVVPTGGAAVPEPSNHDVTPELGNDNIPMPEFGDITVFDETKPCNAIEALKKVIGDSEDTRLLCVSRLPPEDFLKKTGLQTLYIKTGFPVYWLSTMNTSHTLNPTHMEKFLDILQSYIEKNNPAVIYIDGMEYLISLNTFKTVLRFIEKLNEVIKVYKSIVIMPLNLNTLEKKEIAFLEREVRIVHPMDCGSD